LRKRGEITWCEEHGCQSIAEVVEPLREILGECDLIRSDRSEGEEAENHEKEAKAPMTVSEAEDQALYAEEMEREAIAVIMKAKRREEQ